MDFDPEDIVADLQAAIRDHVIADTWFSGIDVYTPDDMADRGDDQAIGDIEQRITQSLSALDKGVCVIVMLPTLQSFASDAPGVLAENVQVRIRIVENALVNRGSNGTRKTCSTVAMRVLRRCHLYTYRDITLTEQSAGLVPDPENVVWDCVYRIALNLPALADD